MRWYCRTRPRKSGRWPCVQSSRSTGRAAQSPPPDNGPSRNSGEPFPHRAQQIREPEGLCQPTASAFLEKLLRIGAGNVAGYEDDPPRQRRRLLSERPIKCFAVKTGHLQIADDDVEGAFGDHG